MAATKTKKKKGTAPKRKPKAKKPEKVTFISRSPNQRFVIVPGDVRRNEAGRVVGKVDPVAIDFENSQFTTDDPKLIAYLRDRPTYNTQAPSGFWELGKAPDELKPTKSEMSDRIMAAVAEHDAEAVQDVLDEEHKGHKRESVINQAESALDTLDAQELTEAVDAEKVAAKDDEPSPEVSKTS